MPKNDEISLTSTPSSTSTYVPTVPVSLETEQRDVVRLTKDEVETLLGHVEAMLAGALHSHGTMAERSNGLDAMHAAAAAILKLLGR